MAAAMDAPPAAVAASMALKRGMQVPLAQRTARHAPQAKPNLAQAKEDVYAPEVALSARQGDRVFAQTLQLQWAGWPSPVAVPGRERLMREAFARAPPPP